MNFLDELYIQLVTLPYNLLLQRSAREALGIDLKDQIVIVDEGHSELIPCFAARSSFILSGSPLTLSYVYVDLIPTLLSLSTVHLSLSLLQTALYQVHTYVTKFRNRLNAANLVQLKRLLAFLDALEKYLGEWRDGHGKDHPQTSHAKGSKPMPKQDFKSAQETQEVLTSAELLERLGRKVVGLNMLAIVEYLKKSKVSHSHSISFDSYSIHLIPADSDSE